MSVGLLVLSFSELMPFDFSPFILLLFRLLSWADFSPFGPVFMASCARWLLLPCGAIFWSDCVVFSAGALESSRRFVGVADEGAARSDDGALCWTAEPAAGASRLIPVPCAFAKPVPAISATAATDTIKRLVIERLLTCLHCPRRQRNEMCDVPRYL